MAVTDRNILRLGTFELMAEQSVPARVVINEAIEIAKKYGTSDSATFINGVLDSIHQKIDGKFLSTRVMSLVGNLEDLPLADILQIVSLSKRTGILTIETEEGKNIIVFKHGLIISAACPSPKIKILDKFFWNASLLPLPSSRTFKSAKSPWK